MDITSQSRRTLRAKPLHTPSAALFSKLEIGGGNYSPLRL